MNHTPIPLRERGNNVLFEFLDIAPFAFGLPISSGRRWHMKDLSASPTEEVIGSDTADALRGYPGHGRPGRTMLADILSHGNHGGVAARFLEIASGHARRDLGNIFNIKVRITLGIPEDQFENATTLLSSRKRNREFLGHSPENGLVNGVYPVGGTEHNNACRNTGGVGRGETIP